MARRKAAPAAPGSPAITLEVALAANGTCRTNREGRTCYQQASALRTDGYCFACGKDVDLSPPGRRTWLSQARQKGAVLAEGTTKAKGRVARPPGSTSRRGAPSRTSDRAAG